MTIQPPYEIEPHLPESTLRVETSIPPEARKFAEEHAHLIPLVLNNNGVLSQKLAESSVIRLCNALADELVRCSKIYQGNWSGLKLKASILFHLQRRALVETNT